MPYMAEGSVGDHLRDSFDAPARRSGLPWRVRQQVACDTARGLSYLHKDCTPPIVHRDIKAANILLNSNMEAVISDFGLAGRGRLPEASAPESQASQALSSTLRGTLGFMPPEYVSNGNISEKSDIFAFGVFLLELVSGCNAHCLVKSPHKERLNMQLRNFVIHAMKEDFLERWVVDPALVCLPSFNRYEVEQYTKLAVFCMSSHPTRRPTAAECLQYLEGDTLPKHWCDDLGPTASGSGLHSNSSSTLAAAAPGYSSEEVDKKLMMADSSYDSNLSNSLEQILKKEGR